MSRHTVTVTVTGKGRTDPDATIGYDPPLRTLFLQAFPNEVIDDPALWLGTYDQQFGTLAALHAAALSEGYDFMSLPGGVALKLHADEEFNQQD